VATTSLAGGLAAALAERDLAVPVRAEPTTDDDLFSIDEDADPDETFPQSIASGGPTPTGAILWTRIDPDVVMADEPLGLQVATDEAFDREVARFTIVPEVIREERDHAVKVDLDGVLESDRFYYYRFVYDGTATRTGRCRTLPARDASPDELSFAVLVCQDYQNGYYGAFHHLAREDVDFAIHLGDFIYEHADGQFLAPGDDVKPGRNYDLPSGASLAESLEDFRFLYNHYKRDRRLQETLERHTVIYSWDDHEIGDNRYWDYATGSPVLPEKEDGDDPEFAMAVTANGIQAWFEQIPARVEYDSWEADLHDRFQLWRNVQFGDLVDLGITDERLYRDGPPCELASGVTCTSEEDADRTMLGDRQRTWFENWVESSTAKWTTWANQVLTVPLTAGDGWNQLEFLLDSWDGFQHERWVLMQHFQDVDPRNLVTLTGDLHASIVGTQQASYGEIEWEDEDPVGVEFMTPAVTSLSAGDVIDFPSEWDDDALGEVLKHQNDHLEFVDWHEHGYSIVEFTRDHATFTIYEVDKDVDSTTVEKRTLGRFRTPDGASTVERLE
jgi:alkaline phosphatase D